MIVDGKKIAQDIQNKLKSIIKDAGKKIRLDVFVVGSDYATEKFIALKRKIAESVGVTVTVHHFDTEITTEDLKKKVSESAENDSVQGIIIQLALPAHINTRTILDTVPLYKDVDVLGSESILKFEKNELDILPPVVGAMKEILGREDIAISGKEVVVVGKGSLVGAPSAIWFKNMGAHVNVVDRSTENFHKIVQTADIIVSGAGVPGLIKKEMLKDGVVLLDAGTSESSGKLSGDADPNCEEVCSVFTPVPGGIGPITIAILLRNLVTRALK